jgi:hypothetical protein
MKLDLCSTYTTPSSELSIRRSILLYRKQFFFSLWMKISSHRLFVTGGLECTTGLIQITAKWGEASQITRLNRYKNKKNSMENIKSLWLDVVLKTICYVSLSIFVTMHEKLTMYSCYLDAVTVSNSIWLYIAVVV